MLSYGTNRHCHPGHPSTPHLHAARINHCPQSRWIRCVSTDHEDQITSYEAQVDYYTRYISGQAGWKLAGIYTDEGIIGTRANHREGFKTTVADALDGKIDQIITKCTVDAEDGLLITIMSSLVQEEALPISKTSHSDTGNTSLTA